PIISWTQSVDKSGVKTNTISLPSGPGSIEGLGESFQPSLNTGQASYGVGFALPAGTAGHTPNLALRYNGGSGNSPMGYGWSMSLPYVQRQSDKGTPLYVDTANGIDDDYDGTIDEADELDVFINEMKEELVQTSDDFYFCENENAFIRYQRRGEHWIAHLPNGTLLEFGTTMYSRVYDDETGNVHSWLLDRMTDTNGNTIVYTYKSFDCKKDRNQKYLHKIEYGAGAPPWDAFHFVRLEYEDRFDWFEDCRAGFKIRTGQRLRHVYTGTQGVSLEGHQVGDFNEDGTNDYLNRKYQLDYDTHQHWSLLSKVTWIGGDGISTYPPISFQYTNISPADTILVSDKMIGEQNAPTPNHINAPSTDLVDFNADGLADVLRTEYSGRHTVYLNEGEQNGIGQNVIVWNRGEEVQFEDARAGRVYLQEEQRGIAHLADMDADGLADLVCTSAVGDVYYFSNQGNKTWGVQRRMTTVSGESAPPSPFGQPNVKTADINFDKHIDIIQSIAVAGTHYYRIWFNLGNQQYSQAVTVTQENGFDLSIKGVHIADFNGDRVPDILWIRPMGIIVTAGLGHGEFDEPMFVPMPDYLLSNDEIQETNLQDLNGDGLVDLIIEHPAPNQMWYWLNQGNYSLDKRRFIFGLPSQRGNTATRWADMNGNGTTDFVHIDEGDGMQVLDIGRLIGAVPAPNLLFQVDNGIGQKTKLEYATSTKYLLEDRQNGNK
ncbi:MAG: FG-GAP-like repeat-containing protein, partial [Bacteroidota bacterium]